MKRFGLIGHPVGHSWSKEIHEKEYERLRIEASYELMDLEPRTKDEGLKDVLMSMDGVNVTIPYKQKVIPLLDWISDEAREVGAVNTIVNKDGKLYGYNTDVVGFREMAEGIEGKRVMVLGDGGAAQAVKYVLRMMGCKFRSVSHQEMDESIVSIKGYDVVVNTTPLGMYPNTSTYPRLNYDEATEEMLFLDLVYNPEETEFMRRASLRGASVRGGIEMLKKQAYEAIKLFMQEKINQIN